MTDATALARDVIAALIRVGVHELVLAPGSRNAPLAFAAWDAHQAGLVRLHTRIDERSAGFLALGLTKVGSRAAVITTSGTAVANLAPAMLEAAHAGVPLVAVTADRPASLRGTNANQTTDQVGIFGPLVPSVDLDGPGALGAALAVSGPMHLNVQFTEPLMPGGRWELGFEARSARTSTTEKASTTEEASTTGGVGELLPIGPRTVVVAGDDAGPPARVLAQEAGWPLFAEPTSGSRTGANAVRCYRLLLDSSLGEQIDRVVVFGHPTLSRPVTRLLNRPDVEVISVACAGVWPERAFPVANHLEMSPVVDGPDDPAWLAAWLALDAQAGAELDELLESQSELTPYDVAGSVAAALPPGGLLVVGASSPIRDLDLMVPRYAVGDRRKTIANRGLAGIDGVVSTAIGAALGRKSSRAFALVGDVTFLHDSNGLILGPDEPQPDLTIVVVNDDGGSIFTMLEQGDAAYADRYERLFGTPHHADLASLCAATRIPHWQVSSQSELHQALANPNGGLEVVEVRVRRDNRRELDARIRAIGIKS